MGKARKNVKGGGNGVSKIRRPWIGRDRKDVEIMGGLWNLVGDEAALMFGECFSSSCVLIVLKYKICSVLSLHANISCQ